jgi:CheY-like chemotaxis protein
MLSAMGADPFGSNESVRPRAAQRRVLVADDNSDAATSLAMLLSQAGYEVRLAHDGEEALSRARLFKPQAAVLDIGMPKLTGYELAALIRAEPWGKHALLIALTGWGHHEHRRRAVQAGFDHHLTKPAEPAELERLIATASFRD